MKKNHTDNYEKSCKSSYVIGAKSKPLTTLTIGEMLDETVENYPENEALIVRHQNIRYTYRELQEKVNQCARGLLAIGLQKGDLIGICSPNNYEWVIVQFASSKIGAILVNINPAYRHSELEYILKNSRCSTIIIAQEFKTSNYTKMMYDLAPELFSSKPGHLMSQNLPFLKTVIYLGSKLKAGMLSWNDLIGMANMISLKELNHIQNSLSCYDRINIQYTSGTTGYPKGSTLTHHNVLNNGYFVGEAMKLTDKDRLVIPVPLYHCFGMVLGNLACVTHGSAMLFPSATFDPTATLDMIEEEKATAVHGVPTMFIAELEHPEFHNYNLTSLRTGLMAGSPCPVEIMKKVNTLMHITELEVAYGMTETSPVSFQTCADAPLDKRVSTVGKIHPHVEAKIINTITGETLPVAEDGELCIRGYSVMSGYWNDYINTNEAIDSGGWMHTGDLAVMDNDGYLNIVGRIKDMIIRGGENVYPREVEELLYTFPKVSDAYVIGVPDQTYGEELMAWVKLKKGQQSSCEEMRKLCFDKIAHFKIPRYFKFINTFPMTVTGKIKKFVMRSESIKELGL